MNYEDEMREKLREWRKSSSAYSPKRIEDKVDFLIILLEKALDKLRNLESR